MLQNWGYNIILSTASCILGIPRKGKRKARNYNTTWETTVYTTRASVKGNVGYVWRVTQRNSRVANRAGKAETVRFSWKMLPANRKQHVSGQ